MTSIQPASCQSPRSGLESGTQGTERHYERRRDSKGSGRCDGEGAATGMKVQKCIMRDYHGSLTLLRTCVFVTLQRKFSGGVVYVNGTTMPLQQSVPCVSARCTAPLQMPYRDTCVCVLRSSVKYELSPSSCFSSLAGQFCGGCFSGRCLSRGINQYDMLGTNNDTTLWARACVPLDGERMRQHIAFSQTG